MNLETSFDDDEMAHFEHLQRLAVEKKAAMELAAAAIQCSYRSYKWRKQKLKSEKNLVQELAACDIQAAVRQFLRRRKFQRWQHLYSPNGSPARSHSAFGNARTLEKSKGMLNLRNSSGFFDLSDSVTSQLTPNDADESSDSMGVVLGKSAVEEDGMQSFGVETGSGVREFGTTTDFGTITDYDTGGDFRTVTTDPSSSKDQRNDGSSTRQLKDEMEVAHQMTAAELEAAYVDYLREHSMPGLVSRQDGLPENYQDFAHPNQLDPPLLEPPPMYVAPEREDGIELPGYMHSHVTPFVINPVRPTQPPPPEAPALSGAWADARERQESPRPGRFPGPLNPVQLTTTEKELAKKALQPSHQVIKPKPVEEEVPETIEEDITVAPENNEIYEFKNVMTVGKPTQKPIKELAIPISNNDHKERMSQSSPIAMHNERDQQDNCLPGGNRRTNNDSDDIYDFNKTSPSDKKKVDTASTSHCGTLQRDSSRAQSVGTHKEATVFNLTERKAALDEALKKAEAEEMRCIVLRVSELGTILEALGFTLSTVPAKDRHLKPSIKLVLNKGSNFLATQLTRKGKELELVILNQPISVQKARTAKKRVRHLVTGPETAVDYILRHPHVCDWSERRVAQLARLLEIPTGKLPKKLDGDALLKKQSSLLESLNSAPSVLKKRVSFFLKTLKCFGDWEQKVSLDEISEDEVKKSKPRTRKRSKSRTRKTRKTAGRKQQQSNMDFPEDTIFVQVCAADELLKYLASCSRAYGKKQTLDEMEKIMSMAADRRAMVIGTLRSEEPYTEIKIVGNNGKLASETIKVPTLALKAVRPVKVGQQVSLVSTSELLELGAAFPWLSETASDLGSQRAEIVCVDQLAEEGTVGIKTSSGITEAVPLDAIIGQGDRNPSQKGSRTKTSSQRLNITGKKTAQQGHRSPMQKTIPTSPVESPTRGTFQQLYRNSNKPPSPVSNGRNLQKGPHTVSDKEFFKVEEDTSPSPLPHTGNDFAQVEQQAVSSVSSQAPEDQFKSVYEKEEADVTPLPSIEGEEAAGYGMRMYSAMRNLAVLTDAVDSVTPRPTEPTPPSVDKYQSMAEPERTVHINEHNHQRHQPNIHDRADIPIAWSTEDFGRRQQQDISRAEETRPSSAVAQGSPGGRALYRARAAVNEKKWVDADSGDEVVFSSTAPNEFIAVNQGFFDDPRVSKNVTFAAGQKQPQSNQHPHRGVWTSYQRAGNGGPAFSQNTARQQMGRVETVKVQSVGFGDVLNTEQELQRQKVASARQRSPPARTPGKHVGLGVPLGYSGPGEYGHFENEIPFQPKERTSGRKSPNSRRPKKFSTSKRPSSASVSRNKRDQNIPKSEDPATNNSSTRKNQRETAPKKDHRAVADAQLRKRLQTIRRKSKARKQEMKRMLKVHQNPDLYKAVAIDSPENENDNYFAAEEKDPLQHSDKQKGTSESNPWGDVDINLNKTELWTEKIRKMVEESL